MTDKDTLHILRQKNNFLQAELKNLVKKYVF